MEGRGARGEGESQVAAKRALLSEPRAQFLCAQDTLTALRVPKRAAVSRATSFLRRFGADVGPGSRGVVGYLEWCWRNGQRSSDWGSWRLPRGDSFPGLGKPFCRASLRILDQRYGPAQYLRMPDELIEEVPDLLVRSFEHYLRRRLEWYRAPKTVLRGLLRKDGLSFALRGIQTADEFAEQAFFAHEASSEETMMGNAWQATLAAISPNSVGGGDLRTERDGTLWIIQVKLSRGQNASAEAQDLRMLKTKIIAETDHHPGRKNVKAMLGFVRGPSVDEWRTYRSKSAANRDIDMFQYQYKAGTEFLEWCSAGFAHASLIASLQPLTSQMQEARTACISAVRVLLRESLTDAGLGLSMTDVLQLTY